MKTRLTIMIVAVVLLCAVRAHAQSDHTFVSTSGVDNATCGAFATPCRTFAGALPQTNSGGEIIALTSGLYDDANITISKNITLTAAPGIHAELAHSAAEVPSITINNGDQRVVLRNLYLTRLGDAAATDGVFASAVGVLNIENCVFDGFRYGVNLSVDSVSQVFIQDSLFRHNRNAGAVFNASGGNSIRASIDHCRFEDNEIGVITIVRAKVTVRDSIASGNGTGFSASGGGQLNIENCQISNNQTGVFVVGAGTVTVSNSFVSNNSQFGFHQSGLGKFFSLGNNTVRHNGTNVSGTITGQSQI